MNFDPSEGAPEDLVDTMRLLERERATPFPEFIDRLAVDLGLKLSDRSRVGQTAELLRDARPLPQPSFRGALARRLRARPAPPERLRLRIAAFAGSGAVLLVIVAVGLAGVGPLAS